MVSLGGSEAQGQHYTVVRSSDAALERRHSLDGGVSRDSKMLVICSATSGIVDGSAAQKALAIFAAAPGAISVPAA